MQIYKTFLKISLRSITSAIIYVVIFTILSFVLSNSQSESGITSFSAVKIPVAVVDRDNSDYSLDLCKYIGNTNKIVAIGSDEDTWPDELFFHTVEYIIVIEKGFGASLSSGDYANTITTYEAPGSNKSYLVKMQIDHYLNNVSLYLTAGYDSKDASAMAAKLSDISADITFPKDEKIEKPTPMSFFFTFLPYIMICILINSLGPMLIIWNRREIKARTAISSMSVKSQNIGITAAVATYCAFVFAGFIILCSAMYKGELFSIRGLLYLLNALMYLTVCAGITFLIAQFTKKVELLSVWSNVIGLSTSFFCGVFVTRSILPNTLNKVSAILPTHWYINVSEELKYFDGTLTKGSWISMGIQLIFAIVFFALAFIVRKSRKYSSIV